MVAKTLTIGIVGLAVLTGASPAIAAPSSSGPEQATLVVTVEYRSRPIADATVRVQRTRGVGRVRRIKRGRFQLAPGVYDVFARAAGYTCQAEQVHVVGTKRVRIACERRKTHTIIVVAPGAPPAEPASGLSSAAQQAFAIALAQANEHGDPDPTSMEYAAGTLQRASEVMGGGKSFFPPGEGPGDAGSAVDLIVMVGHFFWTGPIPACALAPTGPVLSLIVDQQTGFVSKTELGSTPPLLSQLGPVTRLNAEGGADPATLVRTESDPACERLAEVEGG